MVTVTAKDLVEERGEIYGHPLPRFATAQVMNDAWVNLRCQGKPLHGLNTDLAVRHGVYLICDKLTRFAIDPEHLDNLDDIQGYVETIRMCLQKE